MKKIFSIFRLDLKSLTKNLIVFVVVIGITILPALYAWFNIASNWDPYSNTGDISFAVCSMDKGYTYDNIKTNAGEKIVDNLKKNNKMGWEFVDDKDDAEKGVKDGKYYAAVVIPDNFTENLLSVTSGKFTQAKLHYHVNEKMNAIAPKITDKGISAIQESVDASYVSTIAEKIADVLNITNEELEGGKDKLADRIKTVLNTAKTENESFKKSVDLLVTTLDSIDDLIKANQKMLPTIQKTLSKAGVVTGDIKSTLKAAQNTSTQLTTTIEELIGAGDSYIQNISTQLNDAFKTVSDDANAAANKFEKVKTINEKKMSINNKLISILQKIEDNLGIDCSKIISRIKNSNSKQQSIINKIVSISNNIKSAGKFPANAKADVDKLISEADSEFAGVNTEFAAIKKSVDDTLNKSYSDLDKVADFAQSIDLENGTLNSAFKAGSNSISSLKSALNNLKDFLDKTNKKTDSAVKRIDTLKNDKSLENLILPIIEDPKALGEFISAPVSYDTDRVYPLDTYGSAMTPFYSSLALWVGGVVLVAVLNVDLTQKDRKKLGKANPVQLFFGRYVMFFVISQIQAVIIALGDLFFLKIQCDNPLLFIITCMISATVYLLIIYSLTITFSVVGKALAVIILIMQVAGSGGTFPIEVLPGPFKSIAPFLPFRYGINALRETVAGVYTNAYLQDIGMLLLFIIPALLLGLVFRKPCIKAIGFFNEKIEESDLVI